LKSTYTKLEGETELTGSRLGLNHSKALCGEMERSKDTDLCKWIQNGRVRLL